MKVLEDSGERKVELHRRPLGVVGHHPVEFPASPVGVQVPPALLAGNTLVLSRADHSLVDARFADLVEEMLPPGVVNVITDANDLGGDLTEHPDVRKISFTGSSATGKKVIAAPRQRSSASRWNWAAMTRASCLVTSTRRRPRRGSSMARSKTRARSASP